MLGVLSKCPDLATAGRRAFCQTRGTVDTKRHTDDELVWSDGRWWRGAL